MFKIKYTAILLIIMLLFAGCGPADQTDPTSSSPGESVQDEIEETGTEEAESETAPEESAEAEGELTVHYIDVGQGDSILIQAPDKDILIDGGDLLMPFYRFYVEQPTMVLENGLKTFGIYYVPAVELRYLTELPESEVIFN